MTKTNNLAVSKSGKALLVFIEGKGYVTSVSGVQKLLSGEYKSVKLTELKKVQ